MNASLKMIRTIAFAAAALVVAGGAEAANTVNVHGTVSQVCTVSVSDLNVSLNITGGETDRQIATVSETCNDAAGYNITVTSSNSGSMVTSGVSGNPTVPYSIKYDGSSSSLSSPLVVSRSSNQVNKSASITASITALPNQVAASYADTLTVTIAGK